MNEVIRGLHARKSMRVYTDQMIAPEDKRAILEAAMAAPTAGNQQMYTILDITDQSLKDRLAVTCDHQPFIATAPMVLVFCADYQKWYDAFIEGGCKPRRPGVGDLMLAVTDTVIAAQNAVTAAESLGIGSCYIGDIMENCEIHRELLNLPEYVFPAAMVVFGYPTQQQMERPKPKRCRLEDIVCENGYVRKDGAQLREMFRKEWTKAEGDTFDNWVQRFCNRKYNSDFSREMSRSVGEYIKTFAGSPTGWFSAEDNTAPVIVAEKQVCKEGETVYTLPETALVFYMGYGLDYLYKSDPDAWEIRELNSFLNGKAPVYVSKKHPICMVHGGYGAPQAADTVETLASRGVKRIVGVGMCGGYGDVELGDIVIPTRSYVEEGTSQHYFERPEYAEPDAALLEKAKFSFADGRALPIVTTDAVYRQTFYKEALWRSKGCVGVDMECSVLFGLGKIKKIKTVMIMFVSDKHPASPDEKQDWAWHTPKNLRETFSERCLEFALTV